MAIEKTFRETPFNGYNRDDVNAFVRKRDEEFKETEAELKSRCDELSEENSELNELVSSLNKQIEEKIHENFELTEEIMRLKNAELEQNNCICEKVAVIEELQKKNRELEELYNSLKGNAEHQENILKQQETKLSDLSDKNKEFEANLQSYIQNANKLREEAEAGLAINSKITELQKVIDEKDAKIKTLEASWEQCKKDYLLYQEVKNSVSKITDEAKRQADSIISEANNKRERILSEASDEANGIVAKAKVGTDEIKSMLGNLKKAVLDINTKIEFAEMSIDLDKYVESLKKEETPEEKESAHDELVRLLGLNLKK